MGICNLNMFSPTELKTPPIHHYLGTVHILRHEDFANFYPPPPPLVINHLQVDDPPDDVIYA